MSKESNNSNTLIIGLLGVAFVVLKLTGTIDWSWWYVTLPFWAGIPLVLIMLVIYVSYQTFKRKEKLIQKVSDNITPQHRESKFRKRLKDAMAKAQEQQNNH